MIDTTSFENSTKKFRDDLEDIRNALRSVKAQIKRVNWVDVLAGNSELSNDSKEIADYTDEIIKGTYELFDHIEGLRWMIKDSKL